MAVYRRIDKEFKDFQQNMPSIVHSLVKVDLMNWMITLKGPDSSPYEGGFFKILVTFKNEYPFKAPTFRIITKIFHPNILPEGLFCRCCGQCSEKNWHPALTIYKIMFMIHDLLERYDDKCDLVVGRLRDFEEDKMRFYSIARDFTLIYAGEVQDDQGFKMD